MWGAWNWLDAQMNRPGTLQGVVAPWAIATRVTWGYELAHSVWFAALSSLWISQPSLNLIPKLMLGKPKNTQYTLYDKGDTILQGTAHCNVHQHALIQFAWAILVVSSFHLIVTRWVAALPHGATMWCLVLGLLEPTYSAQQMLVKPDGWGVASLPHAASIWCEPTPSAQQMLSLILYARLPPVLTRLSCFSPPLCISSNYPHHTLSNHIDLFDFLMNFNFFFRAVKWTTSLASKQTSLCHCLKV